MAKRRNIDRERLEIYLLHWLLAYRPILLIGGLFVLAYSIIALFLSPIAGCITLGLAILLLLPSHSDQVTLYLAKVGAWLGTIKGNDR